MTTVDTMQLLHRYVTAFNETDEEGVVQAVPNAQAEAWLKARIPRIAVPDPAIERTYYFRWWTYRKHIKMTPEGYVMSEFHPDVNWAGAYNTIPCAAGHHVREGRWLRENRFLDDYIRFWYRDGGKHLRDYSNWLEAAVETLAKTRGDETGLDLIDAFADNLYAWKAAQFTEEGLYWSNDNRDGSEYSVSGPGLRTTLNSYQYANFRALAAMCRRAGQTERAEKADAEADALYAAFEKLWNEEKRFYLTIPRRTVASPSFASAHRDGRELFGYIPWMFGVARAGRSDAFRQLLCAEGFKGAYGPTTAERRHPDFGIFYTGQELQDWLLRREDAPCGPNGHECLWNGPSWPFATSLMLTALANLLSGDETQTDINSIDYVHLLSQYASSHVRKREDGRIIPWIDENLNPDTGDWISRTRLMDWGGERFPANKGGYERGKDYNHSTFCDLVLEGLFGVRPDWEKLTVAPLFPAEWPYAVLEDVQVHGKMLRVTYERGKGYCVELEGRTVFTSAVPEKCTVSYD